MTSGPINEQLSVQLLDFTQKLDITLLDRIVASLYNGDAPQVFCLPRPPSLYFHPPFTTFPRNFPAPFWATILS